MKPNIEVMWNVPVIDCVLMHCFALAKLAFASRQIISATAQLCSVDSCGRAPSRRFCEWNTNGAEQVASSEALPTRLSETPQDVFLSQTVVSPTHQLCRSSSSALFVRICYFSLFHVNTNWILVLGCKSETRRHLKTSPWTPGSLCWCFSLFYKLND